MLPKEPIKTLDCRCSMCAIYGYLHIIVAHADFTLERGAEALSRYRFGSGAAEHLWCSVCGIKSFYQPRSHPGAWSVNAACLDLPIALDVIAFDGRYPNADD